MPIKFPGGVHPHTNKITQRDYISELTPPAKVFVPVVQHIGKPAIIKVQVGDYVKVGTLLAAADGIVSSNIFSPVSGKVMSIENRTILDHEIPHIVIDNDFSDVSEYMPRLNNPTKEQILTRIEEAGIVGMGGAGFPTAAKLSPPKEDKIDTLIINGAECEPYITSDHRIMLEYPEQILKGARYIATALGVDKIIIGVENNKQDAIDNLNKVISANNLTGIQVASLKTKYPQGAEKQLIYALTKRKVPTCELPSKIGVIVNNVHTALSVYYAVFDGQPLYRRVVTVSGGAIKNQGNYWIRTGTTYRDVLVECKTLDSRENIKVKQDKIREKQSELARFVKSQKDERRKTREAIKSLEKELDIIKSSEYVMIINGGPMMGTCTQSEEDVITKTSSSLLFLTEREVNMVSPSQCINCGKCAMVCPMKLMPMFIDAATISGDWAEAKKYGAVECILCGSCSYICPAKRDLVSSMKRSKKMIAKRGM